MAGGGGRLPAIKYVSSRSAGGKVTPWKIDMEIPHLERNMIFQTSMITFHVNLQGVLVVCWWEKWGGLFLAEPMDSGKIAH